jgi:hypothetical protein
VNQALLTKARNGLRDLTEHQLRQVLSLISPRDQNGAKGKTRARRGAGAFRDLKSFGLWSSRAAEIDPVQFVEQIRRRMERGQDAR